jgi:hypothetical protein
MSVVTDVCVLPAPRKASPTARSADVVKRSARWCQVGTSTARRGGPRRTRRRVVRHHAHLPVIAAA